MKLFTKSIDKQLFEQYSKGSDLENQKVIAKIFNPYGRGVWYIMNSDPTDPDYLWAIVDLFEPEMGSVSREELETLRVPPFGLGLERDLYFDPKPAKEVWNALMRGERFEKGGSIAMQNKDMLENQTANIMHHAEELHEAVKKTNIEIMPWVLTKLQRATTDLQDITHYLDGEEAKFASGGMVAGRWYKDNSGKEFRYIGESQGKLLFNDGEKIVEKDEDDFEEEKKEKKLFGFFEEGGQAKSFDPQSIIGRSIDEGKVIKVEDYGNDIFWVTTESWSGLVTQRGFSKDDLIKLTNGEKVEGLKMYDNGGFIEKTDEELKGMNDDELFAYLDAKAAYMKQYSRPLPGTKAKKYAANATAIQFQKEGTSKLEANFPNISKIDEQATKDYEETLAKRLKNKMADGGLIEEVQMTMNQIKRKYPNAKVSYYFAKNPNGKNYVVEVKQDGKVIYSTFNDIGKITKMAKGGETDENIEIKDVSDEYGEKYEVFVNGLLQGKISKSDDKFFVNSASTRGGKSYQSKFFESKDKAKKYIYSKTKDLYGIGSVKKLMGYSKGGKTKFSDKVKAIKASLLKRKKVSPKVQKDYGKTYSPKEAEESAKRIVGSMVKKEKMRK